MPAHVLPRAAELVDRGMGLNRHGPAMELKLLNYFAAIAENGSISRAAALLRISQPALTRYLARLEHQMGGSLFARGRRGVQLTERGSLLLGKAGPLLRQAQLVEEELAAWTKQLTGRVTVAIHSTLGDKVALPLAIRVLDELPGVCLSMFNGINDAVYERVLGGQADIAIVLDDESRPTAELERRSLAIDQLCLVGSTCAGLSPDCSLRVSDLVGVPILSASPNNPIHAKVEAALRRFSLAPQTVVAEIDSLQLLVDMARAGRGFVVFPRVAFTHEPGISWAPIKRLYCSFLLAIDPARFDSPCVRRVAALAEEVAREAFAVPKPSAAKKNGAAPKSGVRHSRQDGAVTLAPVATEAESLRS